MTNPMPGMIAKWLNIRAEIAELERAEHPDLIDGMGRRWTWWQGTLYRHETKAWPREFLPEPITETVARSTCERSTLGAG